MAFKINRIPEYALATLGTLGILGGLGGCGKAACYGPAAPSAVLTNHTIGGRIQQVENGIRTMERILENQDQWGGDNKFIGAVHTPELTDHLESARAELAALQPIIKTSNSHPDIKIYREKETDNAMFGLGSFGAIILGGFALKSGFRLRERRRWDAYKSH